MRRNKMRSGLSALGVIIAVAAVIAMTEIGQGSKATLQKSIASMGANTLMVFSGSTSTGGVSLGTGTALTLTPEDANEIARQCPAVLDVAPSVRAGPKSSTEIETGCQTRSRAQHPRTWSVRDWQNMALGDMFYRPRRPQWQQGVCDRRHYPAGISFRTSLPSARKSALTTSPFEVVGVLGRKGANMMGMDQDNIVLGSLDHDQVSRERNHPEQYESERQCRQRLFRHQWHSEQLSNLYPTPRRCIRLVRPRNGQLPAARPVHQCRSDSGQSRLRHQDQSGDQSDLGLLRERHRVGPGEEDDFSIRDMTEMTKMMSSTTQSMSACCWWSP